MRLRDFPGPHLLNVVGVQLEWRSGLRDEPWNGLVVRAIYRQHLSFDRVNREIV